MRTKLISLAMQGFDRVLVEPSGIFDVDEFYDVLPAGVEPVHIFAQKRCFSCA